MLDRWALAAVRPGIERLARLLVRCGVGARWPVRAGPRGGRRHRGRSPARRGSCCCWQPAGRRPGRRGGAADPQPTDRGAFLDITLDFLFYASIPLAFALADPAANALPAAVLLAAFIGTGSSFLAFAVLAERRG
jgi:hypothetical protein